MVKNYYKILQVHPDADPEIIDVAYRKLAQKYHPDVNRDENASEIMAEINEAYRVLRDPDSRKKYDRERKEYIRKRKEEFIQEKVSQTTGVQPSAPSKWLENLDLWLQFSELQKNWIVNAREEKNTSQSRLQQFVFEIQELYKLTGYTIVQVLNRSSTVADIVLQGKTSMLIAHIDIGEDEIDVRKVKNFREEFQKAKFARGVFFTLGKFSKQAVEWANQNSVILVDYDAFIKFKTQTKEKYKRS